MVEALKRFELKNDHHLGHLLISSLEQDPDAICQIDVATGEKESKRGMLSRSLRLARCLRQHGLQPGDVLAISGTNHLDLHIPYYAALVDGLPMCGIDPNFKYDEVKSVFDVVQPKIAFCDTNIYEVFARVVRDFNLQTTLVQFGEGVNSMSAFMEKYDVNSFDEFRPVAFDVEKVYMWLAPTSGTTGAVKVVAINQVQSLAKFRSYMAGEGQSKTQPMKPVNALNMGPIYWLTGIFNAFSMPVLNQCKIQTSVPLASDELIDVINQYKPISILAGPALISDIIYGIKSCDLSCFRTVIITGTQLSRKLYLDVKSKLSGGCVINMYGQTECIGPILMSDPNSHEETFAHVLPSYQVKLVEPESGKEVKDANVNGELCTKGPLFTEYYKNPEQTAAAFQDGWYKTGDVFCRDENNKYFFVERLKMLIKYRNHHVFPRELEDLILTHPGIKEATVTSIPHDTEGEHPVCCVVKESGCDVTAKEIIDLVADKLSTNKQLRGGVVFIEKIPKTSTGKVAYGKLKQIALCSKREF